jgi:hypothetical protein
MFYATRVTRQIIPGPYFPVSAPSSTTASAERKRRLVPFLVAPAVDESHPDALAKLGDKIAHLSANIHAAEYRLLVMIGRFDTLRGWELDGHRTCAHWLAFRTGIDMGAARERVRAARALEQLPLTSEAMSRGELSFSKVRALTRVAQPATESALLDLARGVTTAQLERMVRAWKQGMRKDEAAADRERRATRGLSIHPTDDGMYEVRGRLTPEVGALVMRAIEAASDALFMKSGVSGEADEREGAQRRADAIGLLAERALAAGFSAESGATVSGTRAQRYQVLLHVDAATLSEDGEPGRSELEDGTRVSAETSRRISCDASVVRITHDVDGSVLDSGRKTRTISPALRRALNVRDRGCRFPGCESRFTDAHHVRHWADGGETSLANCLLLCPYHHTLVHEGGWRLQWWGIRPLFIDPRGHEHFDGRWKPPQLEREPVDALVSDNARSGVEPDAWTASARWKYERDIPDETYMRASEVL